MPVRTVVMLGNQVTRVITYPTAKEKQRAYAAVAKALRCGDLVRPAVCAWCDRAAKVDAHHPDYARPLMVVWICRRCHLKHHEPHRSIRLMEKRRRDVMQRFRIASSRVTKC